MIHRHFCWLQYSLNFCYFIIQFTHALFHVISFHYSAYLFVESGDATCALCPESAVKSCLTCVASFCEAHVIQHYTAPALQRHKLLVATEDLEGRICQQHNIELEFFCKLDEKLICPLCALTEHKGHEIISAPTDPDSKQVQE